MATSILYHTQGIRGFHYKKTERRNGTEYYHLVSSASQLPCPRCKAKDTKIVPTSELRSVRGLPVGLKKTALQNPGAPHSLRRLRGVH